MSPPNPSHASHGPLPEIPMGTTKLTLGAFIFDDADLLDIMGPMRIFGEPLHNLNIEIIFVSHFLKPIRTTQQVVITPHHTLESAPKLDFFFIPGGGGTRGLVNNRDIMAQVKARVEASTWCLTVCTGAGVLAATGLMDGYNMTTNKSVFEWPVSQGKAENSTCRPNVNWIKKARWVQDGKYVTSSGVSAGMDAALFVVSELAGMEVAEEVSRDIEYTWHRDAREDPFAEMYEYTRTK